MIPRIARHGLAAGQGTRSLGVAALALMLAALASTASARTFTKLGVGRGLDVSMGVALAMDAQGLLWVGSREGLYRYDGYEVLAYLPDAADPDSISDVDIRSLHVARDGSLWVGTSTGGLNRLDPATGRFSHHRHDPADPDSLSEDGVYGIGEDAEGAIWVTTRKGVNRVDPRSGRIERFVHDPGVAASLSHDWGFAVHLGPEGALWIGTVGGGVDRWEPATGGFRHFDLAALSGGDVARNDVFALYEAGGHLWAGTRDGLIDLDLQSGQARRLDIGGIRDHGPLITSFSADDRGRLWLGTEAHGVLVVETGTGASQQAADERAGTPGNLVKHRPMSVLVTRGTVFVGTWGDGIYRAPLEDRGFSLVGAGSGRGGLEHMNVTAVMAGADAGRPWVGSFDGSVQVVDVRARRAEASRADRTDPLRTAGVLSLARTVDGQVFAGTTNGLFAVGQDGGSLWNEAHVPWVEGGIGQGYVTALLPAGEAGLWIGLAASGLYYRDTATGQYEGHRQQPGVADSLGSDQVLALAEGADGRLWVGTGTGGLNRCRTRPWSCERFDGSDPASPRFPHRHVTALHQDPEGRLWVATDGGGLLRVLQGPEGKVQGFEHWGSGRGLLSDSIMGIAGDPDGSLWLSTRRGLTHLDPKTGAVESHVRESGLPASDFNANATTADEEFIYFGSLEGLVSLPGRTGMTAREPSPVVVTSIERLDAAPQQAMNAAPQRQLKVPYGVGLSVRFAVLDFAETPHPYQYRIDERDDWTSLGTRREITFIDLSPGLHRFEVRGRDVYGHWAASAPLVLEVVPPFWMTAWFRLLVVTGLMVLVVTIHRARLSGLKKKKQELERLKDEREAAYDDLRKVTRLLESAKEQERLAVSRELHDELGQSLTAAKLSLQMLRDKQPGDPERQRVSDTVTMIDSMIGQVRDLCRSLHPPLLDQAGLVPALEQLLDALADRTGVGIELDASPGLSPRSPAVRIALFRVVQEAVSNALRHSGARRIRVGLRDEGDGIGLRVTDDGVGFDPDSVDERVRRGQHLGMVGMAERVRGVGGTFSVQAQAGSGSRIDAWVPLHDPEEDEA